MRTKRLSATVIGLLCALSITCGMAPATTVNAQPADQDVQAPAVRNHADAQTQAPQTQDSTCTASPQTPTGTNAYWSVDTNCTMHLGSTTGTGMLEDNTGTRYFYPWLNSTYWRQITSVTIDNTLRLPAHAEYLFNGMEQMTTITNTENLDTSTTTDLAGAFINDVGLTSLDVSGWDLSSLTNASSLFAGCWRLTTLDTSGWNLSSLTNASSLFDGCEALSSLDTAGWNLKSLTNANSMFNGCSALTTIGTSGWNLTSLTAAASMFSGCSALTTLDTSGWNLTSLTVTMGMFSGCSALTTLDTSGWNLSAVTRSSSMFADCTKLSSLDTAGWNLNMVIRADNMFKNCSSLTTINASNWGLAVVTNTNMMFAGASSLTSMDTSNWTFGKLRMARSMFSGCSNLTSLDLTGWHLTSSTSTNGMFADCTRLDTLTVGANAYKGLTQNTFTGLDSEPRFMRGDDPTSVTDATANGMVSAPGTWHRVHAVITLQDDHGIMPSAILYETATYLPTVPAYTGSSPTLLSFKDTAHNRTYPVGYHGSFIEDGEWAPGNTGAATYTLAPQWSDPLSTLPSTGGERRHVLPAVITLTVILAAVAATVTRRRARQLR